MSGKSPRRRSTPENIPSEHSMAPELSAPSAEVRPDIEEVPYPVGYKRPPKHTRFRPGQSGYPKGRKKKSRNLRSILNQVLSEDVKIRVGNRVRRMPTLEALVRTTVARAFKADPKAFVSLSFLMKQSRYGEDADDANPHLLSGDNYEDIVANFLARSLAANSDGEKDEGNETFSKGSGRDKSISKEPTDEDPA